MRHIDWQTRLAELIETNRDKPFDFVEHNCLLWAGKGILAVTGKNPVKVAGQYTDEKSALRLKKELKVAGVPDYLARVLEQEPRPIAFARQGDIVFANVDADDLEVMRGDKFGNVPGVCYGSVSFFLGEFGLISYETLRLDSTLWVS